MNIAVHTTRLLIHCRCVCVCSMFQKWMVCVRSAASKCNVSSSTVNTQFDQTKSIIERTCIDRRNGTSLNSILNIEIAGVQFSFLACDCEAVTHAIVIDICLSVCLSVKCVDCDKMKAPSEKRSIMTNRKSHELSNEHKMNIVRCP